MKRRFILLSCLCAICLLPTYGRDKSLPQAQSRLVAALLAHADSLLEKSDDLCRVKETHIGRLRSSMANFTDDEQQYWLNRSLYHEYSTYNSDSALHYAQRCLDIANKLGREDMRVEALLNRCEILTATGLLDKAEACIDSIDSEKLTPQQFVQYCERRLFIGTRQAQYLADEGNSLPYPADVDTLVVRALSVLDRNDPEYAWFSGWHNSVDSVTAAAAIADISASVEAMAPDTRRAAMNAWILARLYEYTGAQDMRLIWLLRSAIADISVCNKEIASMQEAAWMLYNLGDLDHAYRFYDYTMRCAADYKSRVRMGLLGMQQEQVMSAVRDRSVTQAHQSRLFVIFLLALLLIIAAAFIVLLRQHRQLSYSRLRLASTNEELKQRVDELQQIRSELASTNEELSATCREASLTAKQLATLTEEREHYIASIFGICSSYINKLDDFRKNIYHMILARRFDDIGQLTKSAELSNNELKELYANFDSIFLSIYPDFVTDFNTLLRPDEQIVLRNGEALNTELRIYALVRLGLNDSVKIARFLHISPQTVYNIRLRTRNKAIIPKEEFARAVAALGKPRF